MDNLNGEKATGLKRQRGRLGREWAMVEALESRVLLSADGPFVRTARLTSSDGAAYDLFGAGIAISGHTMVVGANYYGSSKKGGEVYVFTETNSVWTERAQLVTSDGVSGIGDLVAISGDTVVLEASEAPIGGNDQEGAAYVFQKPAGGWSGMMTETAKLVASDAQAGSLFGYGVAVDGDSVAVGFTHKALGGNAQQGAVYMFNKPAGGWDGAGVLTESAKLVASDGLAGDLLGNRVAISGDVVIAGTARTAGTAYVFTKPAGGWDGEVAQTAELKLSAGAGAHGLLGGVAISGGTVVVGSVPGWIGTVQGAAYVFDEPPGGWGGVVMESATLTDPAGSSGDRFGNTVGIVGDRIVAGEYVPTPDGTTAGASVFTRSGADWTYVQRVVHPLHPADEVVARPIALGTDTLAIGAGGTAVGANISQGAVWVFSAGPLLIAQPDDQVAADGVNRLFDLGALTAEVPAVGPYHLTVNWGDGTGETQVVMAGPGAIGAQGHVYTGAGDYVVTETVTDAGSLSFSTTFGVGVSLLAVLAAGDQGGKVGHGKAFGLGSFLAGTDTTGPFGVDVDWGDGGAHTVLGNLAAGLVPAQQHVYASGGKKTVVLTVMDAAGHTGVGRFFVTVLTDYVTTVVAEKVITRRQLSSGAISDKPGETQYGFQVTVDEVGPGTVKQVQVTPPTYSYFNLQGETTMSEAGAEDGIHKWTYGQMYATAAARDLYFANGVYGIGVATVDDEGRTVSLALAGDAYPDAGVFSGASLQAFAHADPAHGFAVTWSAMSNGTAGDFVQFGITSTSLGEDATVVFQTPGMGMAGALDGTATGVTVPAGILTAGREYMAWVKFIKIVSMDTTGFPEAGLAAGAYVTETDTDFALAPRAPGGLTAVALSAHSVQLNWTEFNNGIGLSGYQVEQWNGSAWEVVEGADADATSATVNGLDFGKTYIFNVAAVNSAGTVQGHGVMVTTLSPAPGMPTGVTVGQMTSVSVVVRWTLQGSEQTGVDVKRWNGAAWDTIAHLGADAVQYVDTNLGAGTHYYDIVAVNATGATWADHYAAVTIPEVHFVEAATGLAATAVSSTAVHVTWSLVGGETGVVLKQWNGTAWTDAAVLAAGTTSFMVRKLAPATQYYFDVVTVKGNMSSFADDYVSAKTLVQAAPPAPVNLTATAISSTAVVVAWQVPAGGEVTGIYVKRWTGGAWADVAALAANATEYTVEGLAPGTRQYFDVVAVNAFGATWAGTYATVDTYAAVAPATVTDVAATVVTAHSVYVSWTLHGSAGGGAEKSVWVAKWNGTAWQMIATLAAGSTHYMETAPTAGANLYAVVAWNEFGWSTLGAFATAFV